MLEKIKKPYRVSVSEKVRAAGLDDRTFSTKKEALDYIKRVRVIDSKIKPTFSVVFRFIDTATGNLYVNRTEYELDQERSRKWRAQRNASASIDPKPNVES